MPLSYWAWVVALAAALLYPVGRLIWVFSVRRLQRRLGRALREEEIAGQRRRAYFIAVPVCLAFAALFNMRLLDFSGGG